MGTMRDASFRGAPASFVRADAKRHGLDRRLMLLLIDGAPEHSIPLVNGEILRRHAPMRALRLSLGFTLKAAHDDP